MPRIFRHYVPYYLLALLTMEGWIVFASTFASLHVPRIGSAPIYPGPGPLVPKTLVLSLLVVMMLHLWELYRQLMQNPRSQRRLLLLGSGRPAQIIADAVNGSHPDDLQVVLFGKGSR